LRAEAEARQAALDQAEQQRQAAAEAAEKERARQLEVRMLLLFVVVVVVVSVTNYVCKGCARRVVGQARERRTIGGRTTASR
jgi:heme/copper-type cytochrome/quinol oxidase subunit 2